MENPQVKNIKWKSVRQNGIKNNLIYIVSYITLPFMPLYKNTIEINKITT